MAKQKGPTPQELYKARKEHEEIQRTLQLPPGLMNHGNTCFMNSVLQGLIATRYLRSLFQFSPLPPSVEQLALSPIASWRSPLLTNGHGLGGKYEQDWEEGMLIGDSFVTVMQNSWDIQQNRRRESISPKAILSTLGQKYDQYLDFRQQDAHEFLRQLLDAMRMEELDIIKKRQPPPPKLKKQRRRSTVRPPGLAPMPSPLAAVMNHSLSQPTHPEGENLSSFADMLFGGKLTSILVCQNCKHVSHTYEDFNDLSLSIKPEDYARDRKRDRLKNLAMKFKNLHGTALGVGVELQRSSSVPVSPRKSENTTFMDEPLIEEPRRRSLDYVEVEQEAGNGDGDAGAISENYVTVSAVDGKETAEAETETESKGDHVEFLEPTKVDRKDKKTKDDDGWIRLGRRISMTVGLVKEKDQGSRPMDKVRGMWNGDLKGKDSEVNTAPLSAGIATPSPVLQPSVDEEPGSLSPALGRLEPNRLKVESPRSASPVRASISPTISPPLPSVSRFPIITRGSSASLSGKRAKTHRPPKPTAEESAYLRQILADIAPPNPFGIFKPGGFQGTGNISTNLLLKMGQLPGIEECLRMFTAVEILDGENMVGCRRCWKIANGVYKPKPRPRGDCEDSDSDDSEKPDADEPNPNKPDVFTVNFEPPSTPSSPSASVSMSSSIASLDAQSSSIYDTPLSSLSNAAIPWQSTPIPKKTPPPLSLNEAVPHSSLETHLTMYEGMLIPVISTTEPDSSHSTPTTAKPTPPPVENPAFAHHFGLSQVLAAPLPVKDSLRAPRLTRHKRMPGDADSTAESADESSDEALDSDASASTSIFSDSSSIPSAAVSVEQLLSPVMAPPASKLPPSLTPPRTPRPKQVLMRSAYKRYLIATPPPILVIHLKRFQQLAKAPIISFSSGFKKLDDFVSFPECLDIAPFLAPRKEDFCFGQARKLKNSSKSASRCMYRLYAVVVHIGNMLGGHYVAYTALPTPDSDVQSLETSMPTSSSDQSHSSRPDSSDKTTPRKWAYISDTVVRLATLEEVLKAKAYICMYERI